MFVKRPPCTRLVGRPRVRVLGTGTACSPSPPCPLPGAPSSRRLRRSGGPCLEVRRTVGAGRSGAGDLLGAFSSAPGYFLSGGGSLCFCGTRQKGDFFALSGIGFVSSISFASLPLPASFSSSAIVVSPTPPITESMLMAYDLSSQGCEVVKRMIGNPKNF